MKSFTVKVPASSGNLGPGFDVLGLALGLYNELHVRETGLKKDPLIIDVIGEGHGAIARNRRNIVYQSIAYIFKKAKRPVPPLHLVSVNRIPLARGLGSSSAAILAGLLAGNRLLKDKFSRQDILNFATEMEGHPDNVASALLGGVQASLVLNGQVLSQSWPVPKVHFVTAVPSFELSTKKARKVVPKTVKMADAISNLSSVALLPRTFSSAPELLKLLLNDRWHEPYRARLIPGFHRVKQAAINAGAYGVTLSGAGPTILSFTPSSKVSRVKRAMEQAFKSAGVQCKTLDLKADLKGAVIQ